MDFLVPKMFLAVWGFTKKRIQGHLIYLGNCWDNHNGSLNLIAKNMQKNPVQILCLPQVTKYGTDGHLRNHVGGVTSCFFSILGFVNSLLQYMRIQVKQMKGQQLHKFRSKKTAKRSKLCQSLNTAEGEEITYKTCPCSSMQTLHRMPCLAGGRGISLVQKPLI